MLIIFITCIVAIAIAYFAASTRSGGQKPIIPPVEPSKDENEVIEKCIQYKKANKDGSIKCTEKINDKDVINTKWLNEDYQLTIAHFPDRIWDEKSQKCVEATLENTLRKGCETANIAWTKIMPSKHKYDILKGQFVCKDLPNKLYDYCPLNYATKVFSGKENDPTWWKLYEIGDPCQISEIKSKYWFHGPGVLAVPAQLPAIIGVYIAANTNLFSYYNLPFYNNKMKEWIIDTMKLEDNLLRIDRYNSSELFTNFKSKNVSDIFGDIRSYFENDKSYNLALFAISREKHGRFEPLEVECKNGKCKILSTERIKPCKGVISLTGSGTEKDNEDETTYFINLDNYKTFDNSKKIQICEGLHAYRDTVEHEINDKNTVVYKNAFVLVHINLATKEIWIGKNKLPNSITELNFDTNTFDNKITR